MNQSIPQLLEPAVPYAGGHSVLRNDGPGPVSEPSTEQKQVVNSARKVVGFWIAGFYTGKGLRPDSQENLRALAGLMGTH